MIKQLKLIQTILEYILIKVINIFILKGCALLCNGQY